MKYLYLDQHLNGPDQIIPSTEYTTTSRFGHVKLHDHEFDTLKPISIPSMFKQCVELAPNAPSVSYWKDQKVNIYNYPYT